MKGNGIEPDDLDGVIRDLEKVRDTWQNQRNSLEYPTLRDTIMYLKSYEALIRSMADKGIKILTLSDGTRNEIGDVSHTEHDGTYVSHVVRDSGNRWVCECGQGVERWHRFCYHCGRRLEFEDDR